MATINPKLTLTASASPTGPLSFALSLTASDALDVTKVSSEIVDLTNAHKILLDASDYTAAAAEGVDGGFVYLKNLLTSPGVGDNTHDIYIGNATGNLTGVDETKRMLTLKPGEFAWMPWDMTYDLYVDHPETNTNALEVWCFVRTGTA